jgi:hypothetical protein
MGPAHTGESLGSIDAWTSGNCDPRERFINTPFDETDWPAFKRAYLASFESTVRLRREGQP